MAKIIEFGFLILALHVLTTEAIQCLSCDSVANARDCRRLVTCGAHEICSVQLRLGYTQYYKLGCSSRYVCLNNHISIVGKRDTSSKYSTPRESRAIQSRDQTSPGTHDDMVLCNQCCESADGCNKDLCGSSPTTNRKCLSCKDVTDPKHCEQTAECDRDGMCYVHKGLSSGNIYEPRYDMGCMGTRQCNALALILTQSCWVCCNQSDFCNYAACDNWTASTIPSHISVTTQRPPTTSTIHATPPLRVVINGPYKSHYMGSTRLTCVTIPPAQSYRWEFNGTTSLPTGITTQQDSTSSGSVAGTDILTIPSLTDSKIGVYTCVAIVNGHTARMTHSLGIIGEKPTVHITKPPITVNFALQCRVTGYPVPRIQWEFIPDAPGLHGIPPGIQFSYQQFTSTLFAQTYIPREHTGKWYCKASNSAGTVMAQVHVP